MFSYLKKSAIISTALCVLICSNSCNALYDFYKSTLDKCPNYYFYLQYDKKIHGSKEEFTEKILNILKKIASEHEMTNVKEKPKNYYRFKSLKLDYVSISFNAYKFAVYFVAREKHPDYINPIYDALKKAFSDNKIDYVENEEIKFYNGLNPQDPPDPKKLE